MAVFIKSQDSPSTNKSGGGVRFVKAGEYKAPPMNITSPFESMPAYGDGTVASLARELNPQPKTSPDQKVGYGELSNIAGRTGAEMTAALVGTIPEFIGQMATNAANNPDQPASLPQQNFRPELQAARDRAVQQRASEGPRPMTPQEIRYEQLKAAALKRDPYALLPMEPYHPDVPEAPQRTQIQEIADAPPVMSQSSITQIPRGTLQNPLAGAGAFAKQQFGLNDPQNQPNPALSPENTPYMDFSGGTPIRNKILRLASEGAGMVPIGTEIAAGTALAGPVGGGMVAALGMGAEKFQRGLDEGKSRDEALQEGMISAGGNMALFSIPLATYAAKYLPPTLASRMIAIAASGAEMGGKMVATGGMDAASNIDVIPTSTEEWRKAYEDVRDGTWNARSNFLAGALLGGVTGLATPLGRAKAQAEAAKSLHDFVDLGDATVRQRQDTAEQIGAPSNAMANQGGMRGPGGVRFEQQKALYGPSVGGPEPQGAITGPDGRPVLANPSAVAPLANTPVFDPNRQVMPKEQVDVLVESLNAQLQSRGQRLTVEPIPGGQGALGLPPGAERGPIPEPSVIPLPPPMGVGRPIEEAPSRRAVPETAAPALQPIPQPTPEQLALEQQILGADLVDSRDIPKPEPEAPKTAKEKLAALRDARKQSLIDTTVAQEAPTLPASPSQSAVEPQTPVEATQSASETPKAVEAPTAKVKTISGKMDLDEFEAKGYAPNEVTRSEWVSLMRANRRKLGQPEESGTRAAPFSDYEEYHKADVKRAIDAGETVDDRVLADYPDLAPTQEAEFVGMQERPRGQDPIALYNIPDGSGGKTTVTADTARAQGFSVPDPTKPAPTTPAQAKEALKQRVEARNAPEPMYSPETQSPKPAPPQRSVRELKNAKASPVSDAANRASMPAQREGNSESRDITKDDLPDANEAKSITWYHGSGTENITAEEASSTFTKIDSLFGSGIYLTDNPEIASTYAKGRSKNTGTPSLYEVSVAPRSVLNFESPLPEDAAKIVLDNVYDNFKPVVRDAIASGKTGSEVWSDLTEEVSDVSQGERVPISEFHDMFYGIESGLREAGYDAITHIGGVRAGKGKNKHRVLILLDPNNQLGTLESPKMITSWNKVSGTNYEKTPAAISDTLADNKGVVASQKNTATVPRKVTVNKLLSLVPSDVVSYDSKKKQISFDASDEGITKVREAMDKALDSIPQTPTTQAKYEEAYGEIMDAVFAKQQETASETTKKTGKRKKRGADPTNPEAGVRLNLTPDDFRNGLRESARLLMAGAKGKPLIRFTKGLPEYVWDEAIKMHGLTSAYTTRMEQAVADLKQAYQKSLGPKGVGRDISDALKDLSMSYLEERSLAGKQVILSKIPAEMHAPLRRIRTLIDKGTEELIRNDVVAPRKQKILRDNMGSYVTQQHKTFNNPNHRNLIPTLVKDRMRGLIRQWHPDVTTEEGINGILNGWIDISEGKDSKVLWGAAKPGAANLDVFKKRGDWPQEVLDLWGVERDVVKNALATSLRQAKPLAAAIFQRNVLQHGRDNNYLFTREDIADINSGKAPKEKIEAYGKLQKSRRGVWMNESARDAKTAPSEYDSFGILGNAYGSKHFKKAIESLMNMPEHNVVMKALLQYNSLAKMMLTVASGSTQALNFVANIGFFAGSGHMLYKPFGQTIITVKNGVKITREVPSLASRIKMAAGVTGTELKNTAFKGYRELGSRAIELGVIKDMDNSTDISKAIAEGRGGPLSMPAIKLAHMGQRLAHERGNVAKVTGKAMEVPEWIQHAAGDLRDEFVAMYQAGDDFWKMLWWLTDTEYQMERMPSWTRAQAEEAAAKNVRLYGMPYYSETASLVQKLRYLPVAAPFAGYPSEAPRILFNQAMQAKGDLFSGNAAETKMAARSMAGQALAYGAPIAAAVATAAFFGLDDHDQETIQRIGPSYNRNSTVATYGLDRSKGIVKYWNVSRTSVQSEIADPIAAMLRGKNLPDGTKRALLAVMDPYLQKEIGWAALLKIFTNRDDYGRQIYNAADTPWEFSVKLAHTLAIDPLTPGTVLSLQRIMRDDEPITKLLAEATGQRLTKVNMPLELSHRASAFMASSRAPSQDVKKAEKGGNQAAIEEQKRQRLVYHKAEWESLYEDVSSMQAFGVDYLRIVDALKKGGMSKKNIDNLMYGVYEAPESMR